MTEEEWLAATNFSRLLSNPANMKMIPLSERKLRLLVCAYCRQITNVHPHRHQQRIAVAEAFADGLATRGQLLAGRSTNPGDASNTFEAYLWDATYPSEGQPSYSGGVIIPAVSRLQRTLCGTLLAFQVGYIRDIFGNPFRPVTFSPEWRTSTAVALAAQMYESRDFGAMPILADALQDAGCDAAEVLNHCRKPGVHVRGCWVVDLVLGKQ